MKTKLIRQVVNHHLCIGCGLCALDEHVKIQLSGGMFCPDKTTHNQAIEASCPSKGYDLRKMGLVLFGDINYCSEIGYYRSLRLAHTKRESFLENASSGGMITELAYSMLGKGLVDGVITTRFTYHGELVRTETYVAQNEQELINGQGSKYCPTSTLAILKSLDPSKKYLLIGTPCQIAGLKMYAIYDKQFKSMIPYTVTNFCGGYRDYNELDYFISKVAHIKDVKAFRHRGGGQPGSMRIEGENGKLFQYPYPDYAKLSPFIKNERCTLCMDATGELADFSCGDAWLEDRDKSEPWSIIIARSEFADRFISSLEKESIIDCHNNLTADQVVKSQLLNITSKKYRQYKRIRVRDFFLQFSPDWYNNYPMKSGTYLGEIRIMLSKVKSKLLNK